MECLVEMKNISKQFSGTKALDNVSFQLLAGEVHIVLGENGAGKSTLIKILSGVYEPTAGTIKIGEKEYAKLTPKEAAENKISIIYQELSLIDELSIAENIFVGKLPMVKQFGIPVVDFKSIEAKTRILLEKVGLDKNPNELVKSLTISQKQQVEIAKALATDAKIIIMDEPTSSLTIDETQKLFTIIRQLKKEDVGIVYISHKLKELFEIGDRVTVLKDGKYVGTRYINEVTPDDLITMMVGRELSAKYQCTSRVQVDHKEILLKVEGLTRRDRRVKNISFELYKGEVLGFAGLIGSGRTELMNAIFGAEPIASGRILLFGEPVKIKNPYHAIKLGIGMVTENRRETGFFPNFEIWKNTSMARLIKDSQLGGVWGLVNKSNEKKWAMEQQTALKIKCSSVEQNITELSGGNQQKVIVGKWLAANSKLVIFDEPTKGIDVGAKSEIYKIIRTLAEEGTGIIMVSSELPELLAVCDRIVVFKDGEIKAIFKHQEATQEKIMLAATS